MTERCIKILDTCPQWEVACPASCQPIFQGEKASIVALIFDPMHLSRVWVRYYHHTPAVHFVLMKILSVGPFMSQLVKNSNEESVKQQTLCPIKPGATQIAQHQFKTVYSVHDEYPLLQHTIFLQQYRVHNLLLNVFVIEKYGPFAERLRRASIDVIPVNQRDRDGGEQTTLQKQRVFLGGMYVWGVN